MSVDVARTATATSVLRVKRQGARIGLAAAVGFTVAVANGEVLPFLAPMFATQFLVASPRPPAARQAIGMIVLIVVTGAVLVELTKLCGDRPVVLMTMLALIYFACFLLQAQGKGGGAPFLVIVVGVMTPMLGVLQKDLGESVVAILSKAVLGGVVLAWLCHALLPDPGGASAAAAPAPDRGQAVRLAWTNTAILLLLLAYCLVDRGFSTAIVVPITAASLLLQFDHAAGARAALGLMIVNALGGVVASLAFAFIELRPSLPFVFLTVLIVALLFGGRAAADPATGKIYAGALSTFLILLGLGVSPLPGDTPESFVTRIGLVLFAIVCTSCLTALLWPSAQATPPDRRTAAPGDDRRIVR